MTPTQAPRPAPGMRTRMGTRKATCARPAPPHVRPGPAGHILSQNKGESARSKGAPLPENQGGVQGPTHPPCRRGSDVADVAVDVVHFGFFAPETRFVAVNHRRESSILAMLHKSQKNGFFNWLTSTKNLSVLRDLCTKNHICSNIEIFFEKIPQKQGNKGQSQGPAPQRTPPR